MRTRFISIVPTRIVFSREMTLSNQFILHRIPIYLIVNCVSSFALSRIHFDLKEKKKNLTIAGVFTNPSKMREREKHVKLQ